MSINTMEYAAVFMQELDSQMVECATSGWMEDNAGQVQYSGGAEVKIPKMELSGLGNYDRDKGFATGSVTVNYETKKLTQDRGRAFQVDAMDVDETNQALSAANITRQWQAMSWGNSREQKLFLKLTLIVTAPLPSWQKQKVRKKITHLRRIPFWKHC